MNGSGRPRKRVPKIYAYARKSPCPRALEERMGGQKVTSLERQAYSIIEKRKSLPADWEFVGIVDELESAVTYRWNQRERLKQLVDILEPGDHLIVWRTRPAG